MTKSAAIKALLLAGRSPFEIRQQLSVSDSLIAHCRRKLGLPAFKNGRRQHPGTAAKVAQFKLMVAEGKTLTQIARTFGISRHAVFCHLRPDKAKAHNLVHYAVKSGTLIRASHCSKCGQPTFTEGHHEDYSKPLEVQWLCKSCHNGLRVKPKPPKKAGANPIASLELTLKRFEFFLDR